MAYAISVINIIHRVIDAVTMIQNNKNRLLVRITFLLGLLILFSASANATPKFPSPPDSTVNKLGEAMVVNGIPMNIRQFISKNSVHDVLDFYRHYWPKGTEKKPGYTETDILTPWKIITRVEDGYLMTVQVTENGDRGSRGLLGLSKLPDPEKELPTLGQQFPKMRGSTVFNDIQSKDIGKQGRTIQLSNTYSVETNGSFYKDYFTNQGWNVDMDKTIAGGNSRSQRFSNGNKNVIITINKNKNGSVIVAQSEKTGW